MHTIIVPAKNLVEWSEVHPTLMKVFWTLVNLWPDETVRITSLNRTRRQDRELGASGIHSAGPPWRAMDIGIRVIGQDQADHVAEVLNSIWVYDPSRPNLKVALSKRHGSGPHIHLQVHHLTRRK